MAGIVSSGVYGLIYLLILRKEKAVKAAIFYMPAIFAITVGINVFTIVFSGPVCKTLRLYIASVHSILTSSFLFTYIPYFFFFFKIIHTIPSNSFQNGQSALVGSTRVSNCSGKHSGDMHQDFRSAKNVKTVVDE
jgi:hypothetical protein